MAPMQPGVTDVEAARIPRRDGALVILRSSRRLERGDVRHWLTLIFERADGTRRHFTIGAGELDALETVIAEVRRAAKEER